MTYAQIAGVGSYLPARRLTNADLERMVDTSDEWIVTRTGISERRLAAEGETTSDIATAAGKAALADAGVAPQKIDLLVVGTSTADMLLPSAGSLVQAKLGLTCPAFDVNAACTGFVFALHTGVTAIESGRARTVLVVGADELTRFVDFTDRATCVLFGDGAGAVVLEAAEEPGVLGIHLGTDGSGSDLLKILGGGSAAPFTDAPRVEEEQRIVMNGNEVFKFAVRAIPRATKHACQESGVKVEDLTWLIPHQANQRIIDTIADRLGLPHDRVVSAVKHTGNTSAASIPLALDGLYTSGNLRPGDLVAVVGFGAGLTWGAAVVRWTREAR
jgi:3-oxoacyl-[acyl-carrier-protein] synthase-3